MEFKKNNKWQKKMTKNFTGIDGIMVIDKLVSVEAVESELSINLTQEGNLDWRQFATETTISAEYDSKKNNLESLISFKEEIAPESEAQTRQTNTFFNTSFIDGINGSKKDIKTSRAMGVISVLVCHQRRIRNVS